MRAADNKEVDEKWRQKERKSKKGREREEKESLSKI